MYTFSYKEATSTTQTVYIKNHIVHAIQSDLAGLHSPTIRCTICTKPYQLNAQSGHATHRLSAQSELPLACTRTRDSVRVHCAPRYKHVYQAAFCIDWPGLGGPTIIPHAIHSNIYTG